MVKHKKSMKKKENPVLSAFESRLQKLKLLDDKYNGKVTKLLWEIGEIMKEYNEACQKIYAKRKKYMKKGDGTKIIKMVKKIEARQAKKLDNLLSSLPPSLRKELME
ncbi:MAG: hypothetical protein QW112_02740 [Candidatus Micrarchaeia archaeon]